LLLAVFWFGPGVPSRTAAGPAPASGGWLDPRSYRDLLQPTVQRLQRLEFVEMASAILSGSRMGPNDGWFHPSRSRYDWNWLAARHGTDARGSITRQQFRGPAELFARLDRNRDGVLTADDFDWSPQSAYLRQAGAATQLFQRLDTDSNGRISRAEWEALFAQLARGKDYLTADDLRELLQPAAPGKRPAQAQPPAGAGGMPSPTVLLSGLLTGELGSPCEGPRPGWRAPEFRLRTQDGRREIALSDYRGHKPVVLIFGSFT
jgi:hypothetical protein